jgi:hypothetical protein
MAPHPRCLQGHLKDVPAGGARSGLGSDAPALVTSLYLVLAAFGIQKIESRDMKL